ALPHVLEVQPGDGRRRRPPGAARQARRLPAAERLRRRQELASVLGRDGRGPGPLHGRAQGGDPQRPVRERAVHARDARGAARRGRRGVAGQAREAARRPRAAARERGLPQPRRAAADAGHAAARDGQGRPRARGLARRAVQPHRQGDRLPRLQDAPRDPGLVRQVELRQPRHAVPRDRHRERRLEQAVRVRRRAQPRRQRDAAELDDAHRQARGADGPRVRGPHGAPGRVPVELRDRADARLLALDDPLRRGPLHARQEGRARAHAPHPDPVPGRHDPRRPLPRLGRGDPARDARARAGGPLPHEHRRGAQARSAHPDGAEEGHAPDRDDHRRQAQRPHDAERADLQELDGARRDGHRHHAQGGRRLPPLGDHDQHLHARARPRARGVRQARERDLEGQGVLHQHDDARPVPPDGLPEEEVEDGEL
ncbi:MAG: FIG024850: short form Mg-chelase associated protein with vWA domain, partial [uncultured Gemmatimonadaceae bacterium]